MWKEFKEFAMRGNVFDMAVGIVIGAAFGKIITSFVIDVLMPPVGLLVGDVDFSSLFINLSGRPFASIDEAKKAGAPTINYGVFLNTILDFLIVAFAIFLVVRQVNRMKREREVPPTSKKCPYCFSTIAMEATKCPQCTAELHGHAPQTA